MIASSKKLKRKGQVIHTPVLQEEAIRPLLMAADLLVCKKGFLQILEAYSLGTPVICIGKYEGFYDSWVDPQIREVMPYHPLFCKQLVKDVSVFVGDSKKRQAWLKKVKALHNGKLDGAVDAARLVKKAKHRPIKIQRKVLLSLNLSDEMKVAQTQITKQKHLFPVFVSVPYLALSNLFMSTVEGQTHAMHRDLDWFVPTDDILKYGANLTLHHHHHDMHGWSLMFPWVDTQHQMLMALFKEAQEIQVVGKRSQDYFAELLKPFKRKLKLIRVKTSS